MEKSNNLVQPLPATPTTLKLRLKQPDKLDTAVFERMESDDSSIPCLLADAAKGILVYSLEDRISLKDFLQAVCFEKEEGYMFLKMLFEGAISCSRNKPVLFEPEYVFLSPLGDEVSFIVLPLKTENWLLQKDLVRAWTTWICSHLKTTTAYEIAGYILAFQEDPDFSLPGLVQGLNNLQHQYYPRKWYRPAARPFRLKERVEKAGRLTSALEDRPGMESAFSSSAFPEELPGSRNVREEKTELIGMRPEAGGWLEQGEDRYDLLFEEMIVGRGMQCQIRLDSAQVSIRHAKITEQNQRYYIQDLHSSNGTFLEEKQVVRRMRLKEGMKVRFADMELVFHENGT